MKSADNNTANYIQEVKQILAVARQKAYTAVNFAMVEAYWLTGKRIVEEEQHGKERAETLTAEFGKGFSYANLRNFRQFYLTYPNIDICYTLCSKLTWSHCRSCLPNRN